MTSESGVACEIHESFRQFDGVTAPKGLVAVKEPTSGEMQSRDTVDVDT